MAQGTRVSFTMENGSILAVEYWWNEYPDTRTEPGWTDVSDVEYFIDGVEVEYDKLPRGLNHLADIMAEGYSEIEYPEFRSMQLMPEDPDFYDHEDV